MSLQDSSDIHLRISRLDWATTTTFPATRDTCSAMRNSALPVGTHTTADCELLRPATCVTVHPGCAWAFRSPSSAFPCLSGRLYSARCWENPSFGGRLSSSLAYVLFSPCRSHVSSPYFSQRLYSPLCPCGCHRHAVKGAVGGICCSGHVLRASCLVPASEASHLTPRFPPPLPHLASCALGHSHAKLNRIGIPHFPLFPSTVCIALYSLHYALDLASRPLTM